jgi:hypothetical protein
MTTTNTWNVPLLEAAVKELADKSGLGAYPSVSYADSKGKQCSRNECQDYLTVSMMSENVGRIESLKDLPGFLKFSRLTNADGTVVARALFTREQRFHN